MKRASVRLKRKRRHRALRPKSLKQWVFDAADDIVEGSEPGHHIVSTVVRFLKKDLDPVGEKRFLHPIKMQLIRADLAATIAKNRRNGIKAPIKKAREEVAKRWGHNSGYALKRALQPSRANLKPRRQRG